jgi:hypothetical protein
VSDVDERETTTAPVDQDDQQISEQTGSPRDSSVIGRVTQTVWKLPGSREQVPATMAAETELRSIDASTVIMDRSGAEAIDAQRVTMERSGAKAIDTKSAQLDRSGVVALGSEHTVLLRSSAVQVVAEEARISKSAVLFASVNSATIADSRVLIFSGNADGNVAPMFTRQTAAILGAALGFTFALIQLLLRARSGD